MAGVQGHVRPLMAESKSYDHVTYGVMASDKASNYPADTRKKAPLK